MANDQPSYERLTRARSGLAQYTSLWLGADHVLLVESSGFHESYHRIYLRDIQAFVAADSDRYLYFNIGASVGAVVTAIPFVRSWVVGQPNLWMLLLVLPALIVLITNLVVGPSCRFTVVTALQTRLWPPLSRWRRARRVLARLDPLIRAAQAPLATTPTRNTGAGASAATGPASVFPPTLQR